MRWARCRRCTQPPSPASKAALYIGPDGPSEQRGHPTIVQPNGRARDEDTARRLWQVSEELTGSV